MKLLFFNILLISCLTNAFALSSEWTAKRITARENQNESNSWIDFVKTFEIDEIPVKAVAKIACDSKYWLWINGELVVFEGQLKRGPNPVDTYYDEVDITAFLNKGNNKIAILVWYFGKDGYSHNSSGEAGLVFECNEISVISNASWFSRLDRGFENTARPYPNHRLSESNVRFDARKGNFDWVKPESKVRNNISGFSEAKVQGNAESAPWNKLVKRPIPFWKDYGLKEYIGMPGLPFVSSGDTIICKLPYNTQLSPYFKIESEAGNEIGILTDHYYVGGSTNIRAEYVTHEGVQEYESLGWMNGHHVLYYIPKGIKVLELKYRETGFNTEFTGSFSCNDKFFNKLWEKSVRTLYVTMRDTYMDCPDRERAQWWGDMVNESGEAFYALSPSSSTLTKKGILELINWQRKDNTIYSPVPSGNYNRELPGQMLASIGYYGFWNYYLNTNDKETIEKVYAGVKRYLDVWKLDENGILIHREGDWYWGDWGRNIDKQGIFNAWYYLALKGFGNMSELLGNEDEAMRTERAMAAFKIAFNKQLWSGEEYRSTGYNDETDDRLQALAVVAGLVSPEKYPAIFKVLQTEKHASPYMEKYVIEALFPMGTEKYGLKRLKERFSLMVNDPDLTTMYEGWGTEDLDFRAGSVNHAWSGGGLTILSQYVCGLSPITAGWKSFQVKPQLAGLKNASATVHTSYGLIIAKIKSDSDGYQVEITVPGNTTCQVVLAASFKKISINGKKIPTSGSEIIENQTGDLQMLELSEGKWIVLAK